MKRKPNILWICSDQQRYDTLGTYGNTFVATPNLDRLAAHGVQFNNAFVQSPFCSPSRGSFLTGRYPRTCRQRQNGADIPPSEVLVTKTLRDAGYTNGLSGKLHLCAIEGRRQEPRIDDGYEVFHWSHAQGGSGDNEYQNWLKEKGVTFTRSKSPHTEEVKYGMAPEHSQTAWCCEKAGDFIRDRAEDGKPWLFSVNMFDPHHAFDAPYEYIKKYLTKLDDIPLPAYEEGELDNKPVWQQIDHDGAYGRTCSPKCSSLSDKDHRMIKASYWAMCELIDEYVGRLIQVLEATGQRDNTLIIYTSDHGEMLGDHGIYLKGPYFYDCAVKVPLILNMPGTVKPRQFDGLVESLDIAQTILDCAGIAHHPGMQGKSLWPIVTDPTVEDHREDVYCEAYNACNGHNGSTGVPSFATMVRTREYKLVAAHNQNTGELYDLKKDPNEHNNLWDDPGYAAAKSEMLFRLCNRMAFTVDPLPERIAPW